MTETSSTPKRGRRLAGVIAGALVLGVLPLAIPASAQTDPLPDPQGTANACPVNTEAETTDVPEDGFTDVPQNNVHEFAVDCVAWYQITSGTSATTYTPDRPVQRDQMATFIAQLIDYVADRDVASTGLEPAPSGNQFPCDVSTSNVHFDNIQRLAAADIVVGTGTEDGEACFDPGGTITRAQMASFIRQAQDVVGTAVPDVTTGVDHFVDDDGDTHEDNINAIAAEGIVRGTGNNANNEPTYSPGLNVPRDQMASFLANKLDRLVEDTGVDPPPYATVTADPNPVVKGEELTVTATGFRGTVSSVTAAGCGAAAETSEESTPDEVVLTIPATQANGDCDVTVVTSFDDTDDFGGEDRTDTDIVEVTVVP